MKEREGALPEIAATAAAASPEQQRLRRKRTVGFRDISAILVSEIRAGHWTQNALLPSEMELVERFGVGRNTVREALRELQSLGYIRRRRGARSVLATLNPEISFVNSVSSVGELLEYARSVKATVLMSELVRIGEPLARRLGCPDSSEWLRIGLLRSREGQGPAFCYSEVYVDPAYKSILTKLQNETEIYRLIEREHGILIRRVEQEIEATLADANIASRLNVAVDSAILLVRTRFFSSDGKLVEVGLAHFPSGRYRVKITLDRRSSPGIES